MATINTIGLGVLNDVDENSFNYSPENYPSTPSTPGGDSEGLDKSFNKSPSKGKKLLTPPDRSPRIGRKVSLKEQKKSYKNEKRRMAKKVTSTLLDPAVIILSSWLKIRGALKNWARFWCLVKPGALIIYRNDKEEQWVGTVILNGCEVIERPSKKEGFCFKIYHPLQNYIWATKGPRGEIAGTLVGIPLPKDHLILRAGSQSDGMCWLDALEVSHKQAHIMHRDSKGMVSDLYGKMTSSEDKEEECAQIIGRLGERDVDELSNDPLDKSESEDENMDQEIGDPGDDDDEPFAETIYIEEEDPEYLGESGEATEDMEDEGKSILWSLMKQVKPGMDLSRVTLPTFILEPRSFLDKLSDFYFHADILSKAAKQDSPYERMKLVAKWYLSGFYKKPKGLKKPYNPIIGETFRCYWKHPESGTRTFFVSEQLSHHPPISGFYVANRQDGFVVNGSILAKSKFYGNSTSAIMDGFANLTLLSHGEDYLISMPYAHCKGLLIGTLSLEMGGTVKIECEKTGYHTELEFKLKPFWKKSGESNRISGKIRLGKETLCRLEGKWDGEVLITDLRSANRENEDELLPELFWEPTPEVRSLRLKRHLPGLDKQGEFESQNLWRYVGDAIRASDQTKATEEKFKLEEEQRRGHRERKEQCEDWVPKLFDRDPCHPEALNRWIYKYKNVRPWDPITDLFEYERDFLVRTKTRIRAPMVKHQSLIAMEVNTPSPDDEDLPSIRRKYGRSSPDNLSSVDEDDVVPSMLLHHLKPVREAQVELKEQMRTIRSDMRRYQTANREEMNRFHTKDWVLFLFLAIALLFQWYRSSQLSDTTN